MPKIFEPYKMFFPISILGSIAGVSLWILAWVVQKKWIDFSFNPYPAFQHVNIMTSIFLLPVVKGFIFTAIPRFTATVFFTRKEIFYVSILQFLILTFAFFYEDSFLFYTFQSLDFGFLFLFIIHRFRISKVNLSKYLHFLSGGIFLGLIGSLCQLCSVFIEKAFFFQYGKDFIFYGMVPCIIFGTGTRMIPMIVNAEHPMIRMEWMKKAEMQTFGKPFLAIFIFSFFIEMSVSQFLGIAIIVFRGIRFIICTVWIVKYFHIFEISKFQGKLARAILFSCYMFIIGLAGYSFGIQYSAHLAHLYLVGGLSLLILSIMTRVTLSHGGGDMAIEKNSNIFYWIMGLTFIAAITRGFVFAYPDLATSHLAYAAILYIFAFLLWFMRIGRTIFGS